ncbi:MAG: AraC family transcriptional regulator [Steroidobacteraceae bacterium]
MPASARPRVEPLIWASVLRGLQLPLAEHNLDFGTLLAEVGVAPEDLVKLQGKVPLRSYLRLMERAAELANDPLIGARMGRSCGPETLGAVGFLFLSSRTLGEALTDFCAYLNLLQDTTDFRFTQDREHITFNYQIYGVGDLDCRQDVEFSLALTSRLIRMYAGGNVEIGSISFRHSPSAPISEYERLLRTEVRFEQDSNTVRLAARMSRIPSHNVDSTLASILKDFLDKELEQQGLIRSLQDQVRQVLISNQVPGPVTARRMARYLGISEASLYRKLKSEGRTFGNLLDETHFELARHYLDESALPITQIAHIIGFAESASFTRAFSRWSGGLTPSAYRRRSRDG